MPLRSLDTKTGGDPSSGALLGHGLGHPETVVVVSRSPVNLIVLSRIVERARLRAVNCDPSHADREIASRDPLMVILDGGPDLHDCDQALPSISARKSLSAGARPHVVMLTTRNMSGDTLDKGDLIDSLVAKPVTPERLQPLIERLRDRDS
jgi:CheY-like chemotaxis protein